MKHMASLVVASSERCVSVFHTSCLAPAHHHPTPSYCRMRLDPCLARPSDDSETLCSAQCIPPLPFCRVHFEEYCTLKGARVSASRDIERLGRKVEGMIKDDVDYMNIRDIRNEREVVGWYLEVLDKEHETREMLRMRFYSAEGKPILSTDYVWAGDANIAVS